MERADIRRIRAAQRSRAPDRAGASLVAATFLTTMLSILALSALGVSVSAVEEQRAASAQMAARYAAESGLAAAIAELRAGEDGILGKWDDMEQLSGSTYWTHTEDLGGGFFSLVSTGLRDRHSARLQLVLTRKLNPFYLWGAFGGEGVTIDSNARLDSYNSLLGTYGSQYDPAAKYANDGSRVGSNGDIVLSQNAAVFGDAHPGQLGSVSLLGNSELSGASSPLSEPFYPDPFETPNIPSAGPLDVPDGTTKLPAGTYAFDHISVGTTARLEVKGPATIVVDSIYMDTNCEIEIDGNDGPVEFYVRHDFVMRSNTVFGSKTLDPADISLFLESDNILDPSTQVDLDVLDQVELNSNSELYASIHAPNAYVELNSNFKLYGSLVARRLHLDSNAELHFDEHLAMARAEWERNFQVVGLRVHSNPRTRYHHNEWRVVDAEKDVSQLHGAVQ